MPESTFKVSDILRAVAGAMQTPVVVILILFIAAALFLIGWVLAELFTERRHLKVSLPALLEEIRVSEDPAASIKGSGLLKSQKKALMELTCHPDFSPPMREALAARLLQEEQARYEGTVRWSELLAKVAPMFGLLGTLIPLGPGIIALGQGDTYTLSASLLTAFDTTIAGLLVAAPAAVISSVRRGWYKNYMSILDAVMEGVLERLEACHEAQV
jgi:biopolymer transport protein ExbB/TolQ